MSREIDSREIENYREKHSVDVYLNYFYFFWGILKIQSQQQNNTKQEHYWRHGDKFFLWTGDTKAVGQTSLSQSSARHSRQWKSDIVSHKLLKRQWVKTRLPTQYLDSWVSVICVAGEWWRQDVSLSSHWQARMRILNLIGDVVHFWHRQQVKDLAGN